MIRILIFLFSVLLVSCSSAEKKSKFDEIIGPEHSQAYKDIIEDFEENKLDKIYPDLEADKSYQRLLKDILDRKIEISDLKTEKGERTFYNTLQKELECTTDSVWIGENHTVFTKRKCWNPKTQTYHYKNVDVASFRQGMNKDSIINSFKNLVVFNNYGNYIDALKAHNPKSEFLSGYIQMKEAAGDIAFYIIAENMIKANVNFNTPIMKRILITEIICN